MAATSPLKEHKSYFDLNKMSKIAGLILIGLACIMFFSLLSYVIGFRIDQSIAVEGWNSIKETEHYKIQNWLNKIGVFIGYLFIDRLFGLPSFIIPMSIFLSGINLFVQRKLFSYKKIILYPILFITLTSSFLALFQLLFFRNGVFPLGGNFGNILTGSASLLYDYLGLLGTMLVWIIFSMLCLVWFTNIRWSSIQDSIAIWLSTPSRKETVDTPIVSTAPISYSDTLFEKDNIALEIDNKAETPTPQTMSLEVVTAHDNVIEGKEKSTPDIPDSEFIIEPKHEEKIVADIEKVHREELKNLEPYDPKKDLSHYRYPTIDLLENHGGNTTSIDRNELENNKNQIVETLKNFNISISSIRATVGPTVTLYEITPAPGVRVSTISRLENDIALSLAALGIRIIAPIPGKGTIGIEVPNKKTEIVSMRSAISAEKFQTSKMELPIALGKNISNEMVVVDLATMPHLLMAGATGKGKSVGINAILVSLLYRKHPSELKFVMVDPKKVELSIYSTIEKHFLAKLPNEEEPIITDVKKVVNTLNSLCIEMDDRYNLLKKATVRNIKEYNEKFVKRQLNPLHGHRYMPYFVLVIDEYADLIITAGKEVEMPLARIAQLARAIGIHVILATQRPAANILTGLIRANFPTKIAFAVSKAIDSNIILDSKGAEQLIGRGDMLYAPSGGDMIRLQCPFVDTPEVDKICRFIEQQQGYSDAYLLPEYYGDDEDERELYFDKKDIDPLFEEAAKEIVINQLGSVSLLQRKLSIGHGRAGRLVDQLEAMGVVGPMKGSKPRDVHFKTLEELAKHLDHLAST